MVATSLGCHYVGASMWYPDTRSQWNYLVGAVTRLCRKTPQYTECGYRDYVRKFNDYHDLKGPIPIITFKQYLDQHTSYTSDKKTELLKLHNQGNLFTSEDLWRISKTDSFLKFEPYEEIKKPRLINPKCDEYKAYVAHIHHSMDKFIYQKLARYLVKGLTTAQRTALLREEFAGMPNITTSDFTSQENSIKDALMEIECDLIELLLQGTGLEERGRYIQLVKSTPQRVVGHLTKMLLDVMRCSGDPDTSSMNAYQTIMSTTFSMWSQLYTDMTVEEFLSDYAKSWRLRVEGDDVIMYSTRGRITNEHYTKLGFIAKIEHHDTFRTASFCGQVLSSNFNLFTNPYKFLLKLGWAPIKYHMASDRTKLKLLVAKCYSALYQYPGCPVIHPICARIVKRNIHLIKPDLSQLMYDDPFKVAQIKFSQAEALRLCDITVEPSDRQDFCFIYGITPYEQLSVEETRLDSPWSHPSIDRHLPDSYFEFYADQITDGFETPIRNHSRDYA